MQENIDEKLNSYCNSLLCDNYKIYALLVPVFFEMDNAHGEGENVVIDNNDTNNKTANETQNVVETQCKSPCPPTAEMCVEMCE